MHNSGITQKNKIAPHKETYGPGRYLDLQAGTDRNLEGKRILDFNKAYNPWCPYRLAILSGASMLLGLLISLVPRSFSGKVFTGSHLIDPLIGAALESAYGSTRRASRKEEKTDPLGASWGFGISIQEV